MKKILFLALGLLLQNNSFGSDLGAIRPEMTGIVSDLSALQKFLVSEAEFTDPKNEKEIRTSLQGMTVHILKLQEKELFKNDPALSANINMLAEHMRNTEAVFSGKQKSFARFMINGSLQMCISCHTRNATNREFTLPFNQSLASQSPLEYGEFLIATRQFTKAREILSAYIDRFVVANADTHNLHRALLNMAILYSRVKGDPTAAIAFFTHVQRDLKLPSYINMEIKYWLEDFKSWVNEKKSLPLNPTAKQLLSKANDLLKGDDLLIASAGEANFHIRRLRAMATLYDLLNTLGSAPEKGEALLLLGKIYHRLNHNLFFRFDDMYLKSCIKNYPKTKLSRNCYDTLEKYTYQGYSGSAGSDVPQDVKDELAKLREKIN